MMTDILQYLPRFCYLGEGRAAISIPFAFDIDGERHAVATDGRMMLVVRGDYGLPAYSSNGTGADIRVVLNRAPTGGVRFPLATLRAFLKCDAPSPVPCPECAERGVIACPECAGTGESGADCECTSCGNVHNGACDRCEGDGELTCTACHAGHSVADRVRVDGKAFNRALLAHVVRHLPDTDVLWQNDADQPEQVAVLSGDGWRAYVMPIRDSGREMPSFDVPHISAGAA